jgi:hypothetical protein
VAYRTLYLLLALPALACCVLPRASAQSDLDPGAVLRPALVKMAVAARSTTRFTYLDLNHTVNLNEKGSTIADTTQLFEVTYIGDTQYAKLLKKNGK